MDLDFGPVRTSDSEGNRFSLYKTGEPPRRGYPDPRKVEWVYAENLVGSDAKFVDDGAASSDCVQGNLGDCWFISALSILAVRDELLTGGERGIQYNSEMIIGASLCSKLSKGVWPPIFHKFRSIGLYVLRFFKNFQWVYVIVDERIPVDIKTKQPVFGRCKNPQEIWVPLIEKAYAKLHGCYENLISGYIDEGVQELTGLQPFKVNLQNPGSKTFPSKFISSKFPGNTKQEFWNFLVQKKNWASLMGCSITGKGQ